MDGQRFDDLARRFADPLNRRRFVRGLVGGVAGALLGARGVDAACSDAGAACGAGKKCCGGRTCLNGTCCPDNQACGGACCPTGFACQDGVCVANGNGSPGGCPSGQGRCDGVCTDLTTTANCGACGRVCPASTDPCLVAACLNGACGFVSNTDGTPCDDGNACTQTDTCQSGTCVGSNPVVCAASDQCHDVGVCDPATGQCSNPPKPNGMSCSDNNACTDTDTCQQGVCTPGTAVVCHPLDECHVAGVCNPATGQCSNPPKPAGSICGSPASCSGGTQHAQDTCNASGVCVAGANSSCGLYDCGATTCLTNCATDNDCVDTAHCFGGACVAVLPNGQPCDQNSDCQSGICNATNGICCSQTCGDGVACVGPAFTCDDPTCGGPGQACCAGNACDSGGCSINHRCEPCGDQYEICCFDSRTVPYCNGGLFCPDGSCWPGTCGFRNEPCCDGTRCHNGLFCDSDQFCRLICGGPNQPCCDGACNDDAVCDGRVCRACGGQNEPCCLGETCDNGLTCGVSFSGLLSVCVSSCGGDGETCCLENGADVCDTGFECASNARCVANGCGAPGQTCCYLRDCDAGAPCSINHICEPCGNEPGQPCCFGNVQYCNGDLVCPDRTCAPRT